MAKESRIRNWINTITRKRALHVLNRLGLERFSAINMYWKRIGDTGALPFTLEMTFADQLRFAEADVKAGRIKSFKTVGALMKDLYSDVDG